MSIASVLSIITGEQSSHAVYTIQEIRAGMYSLSRIWVAEKGESRVRVVRARAWYPR